MPYCHPVSNHLHVEYAVLDNGPRPAFHERRRYPGPFVETLACSGGLGRISRRACPYFSERFLINLEEYLGPDAFAGRGYPETPCRVPVFDLADTLPTSPGTH